MSIDDRPPTQMQNQTQSGTRPQDDEHVATLLSQAAQQFGQLARDEIQMIRAETSQPRRYLGFGGGLFGAAGVLAFIAIQAVAAAVIAALALAMPVWLAALIVGVAAGLGAAIAALLGKKQVERAVPAVGQTLDNVKDSVKADVAAIKEGGQR